MIMSSYVEEVQYIYFVFALYHCRIFPFYDVAFLSGNPHLFDLHIKTKMLYFCEWFALFTTCLLCFKQLPSFYYYYYLKMDIKIKLLEAEFHEEKLNMQHKHDLALQKVRRFYVAHSLQIPIVEICVMSD